ncbi:MAG: hypothetical protein L3J74_11275 [Bacteroidales bacterium]|nr:hypothetical protein [Bacteroidales bacterium]
MKSKEKIIIFMKSILYCALILIMLGSFTMQAQKKSRAYLKFNYFKGNDGSKMLVADLKTKVNRKFRPVQNAEINFYVATDTSDILLGKVKTNDKGRANFIISDKLKVKADTGGVYTYIAKFAGNDTLKAKTSDLQIQDILMDLALKEIDSIKTLTLSAFSIKNNGEKNPLNDVEITFYAKRLFSLLPLGKKQLSNGTCSLEFPTDLPGDSAGNVLIFAKIEDNDNFGNVEKKVIASWGIPVTLNKETYDPFTGGPFASFLLLSVLLTVIIVYIVNKKLTE